MPGIEACEISESLVEQRSEPIVVIALIACFNRRAETVRILEELDSQTLSGVRLSVILVDDASSDGTARAVREKFPAVKVVETPGGFFWARAMRLAMSVAIPFNPDYLVWLNDDVSLFPDTIQKFLTNAINTSSASILVGATLDKNRKHITYSGFQRTGRAALNLSLVYPDGVSIAVDTMNGNAVLIPAAVFSKVGVIDGGFRHGCGDIDYGYRARRAGFQILLLPEPVGLCDRNSPKGTWLDSNEPMSRRLRLLFGPKGMPVRNHVVIERRFGPSLWPLFVVGRYLRAFGLVVLRKSIGSL